jgi:endothelin-converting enzyme/putative endopeptidase
MVRTGVLGLWCLAFGLISCTAAKTVPTSDVKAVVDEAALDRAADPCQDFYQFACGGWMKGTPIPPDRSRWVRSFSEIEKRNQERVRTLLEALSAADPKGDQDSRKLGDLYATCMDEAAAETASLTTLRATIAAIDAAVDGPSLARAVAALQEGGADALFSFHSSPDFKDATQVIGVADQGGLGLPDRDMYEEARFEKVRALYLAHLGKLLELMGEPAEQAQRDAQRAFAIEAALAKAALKRAERRRPENVYHRLERKGLAEAAPRFAWDAWFEARGLGAVQAVNVAEPAFFKALDEQLAARGLDEWRSYLRAQAVSAAAPALGKAFVEENFRYHSAALSGAAEDLPRWKRCATFVDRAMGQALGRLFVQGAFAGSAKDEAQRMIGDVERAFAENVATLAWMDQATQKASLQKLRKVFNKIGFADKWRDYSALEVSRASHLGNAMAAARFESRRQLDKIGKPLDRGDWRMSPPTVNAYYNASLNEMVFPAGILQSPFFALSQDEATNYGAAGYVMGHELTHGFDDKGRRFDGDGNLRDWWSPEVGKAYEQRAQCVADQYSGYAVLGGELHLNGKLTLGENIADIGGLKLAWRAFQLRRAGRPEGPKVAGFSEDQRFYVSAAQVWCENVREQEAQTRVKTDTHSPGRYRVNGAFADQPDFAKAFACPAGSPMAPKDRCEVW